MENKSLDKVCDLLRPKGFDESIVQDTSSRPWHPVGDNHTVFDVLSATQYAHIFQFLDEDMDGEAVCTALASCPGPDCLKEKCGPRLRVYKALRAVCLEAEVSYKIEEIRE